jgi:hypothetical protein
MTYAPQNKIVQIRKNFMVTTRASVWPEIPWNFSDSNISNGHFIFSSASNQVFNLK